MSAYASESEVVRDGLRALFARERAVERWLSDEVAAAHDELRADPSVALGSEEVRVRLAKLHRQQLDDASA